MFARSCEGNRQKAGSENGGSVEMMLGSQFVQDRLMEPGGPVDRDLLRIAKLMNAATADKSKSYTRQPGLRTKRTKPR